MLRLVTVAGCLLLAPAPQPPGTPQGGICEGEVDPAQVRRVLMTSERSSGSARSALVVVIVSVAVAAVSGLWALRVWDTESDAQAAVPEEIEYSAADAGALVSQPLAEPRAVPPDVEATPPPDGPPRAVSPKEAAYAAKYEGMPLDLLRVASKNLSADVREIGNAHVLERFDAGLYEVVNTYLLEEHDPENPPAAQGRPGIYSGFRTVEAAEGVMEMRRVELLPEEYPSSTS